MPSYRGRDLYIDGISAQSVVRRFGSPLYVYSKKILLDRYLSLKTAFSKREPLICYALKANSNKLFCRTLSQVGCGAEVVSGGELLRALGADFKPEHIVFSGVGKTKEEIALGLRHRILTFNVESEEEFKTLETEARRLKIKAPFSIRLNPDVRAKTHPHIATGAAGDKFGMDKTQALALFQKAKRSPWLKIMGIHCHIGSQILELGPYQRMLGAVTDMLTVLQGQGINLPFADIGGGFGISYDREPALDIGTFAREVIRAFTPWPQMRLIIEPGRYLAADAGVLLTRVLYRKKSGGRRFIVVDAAMNDLARPALYGAYHPIWPAYLRGGKREKIDVVGPVCESGDFLARDRALVPLEQGDILAVLKAGAYGFSMSSQYNSRPRAAEVLVDGRRMRLIRYRETMKDLVQLEN